MVRIIAQGLVAETSASTLLGCLQDAGFIEMNRMMSKNEQHWYTPQRKQENVSSFRVQLM